MTSLTQPAPHVETRSVPRPLAAVLETDGALAPAIARVALGAVMLPHGLQKTFGLFGGYGFEGTMGFFTESIGLPWFVALLVIAAESLGALMLLVGLAARFAAVGVGAVMLGAILTTHLSHGFFMNWFGAQAGEGYEFHLLAIGLAAVVAVAGAGRASIDRALTPRLR